MSTTKQIRRWAIPTTITKKNNINTKNENKYGNKHKIRNAVNNKNKKNYNNNDNNNHNEEQKYVIMKPMELTSKPIWFWSKNGKIKPVTKIKKNTTRDTNGVLQKIQKI